MRIDGRLNIVVPVDGQDGEFFVHATPLSREVFEKYFLLISKTFAAIYTEELNVVSGPRVAALMLRRVAENLGIWEGPDGIKVGLMAEIRRLSNVVLPGPDGWITMPFETALQKKLLTEDDQSEVEGAIVFFILASAVHSRRDIGSVLESLRRLWGIRITRSNATDYSVSLQTSIEEETTKDPTNPTAAALSLPT